MDTSSSASFETINGLLGRPCWSWLTCRRTSEVDGLKRYTEGVVRLERITTDPDICHGQPTIRRLRYPVQSLLETVGLWHDD